MTYAGLCAEFTTARSYGVAVESELWLTLVVRFSCQS